MNRMVLTGLLKNIIDLYIEDKFTYIYIIETLDKIDEEELDEDKCAYLQADLIKTLFQQFPYYRLLSDLTDLVDYIIECTEGNPNFEEDTKLLKNGCLGDMLPDIKRRVMTETMAHITELLYMYKAGKLESDIVLEHLTKNMYDPNILTSMDSVENTNYKQEAMPWITIETMSLRETISKSNNNRKEKARKNLEEYTIENFNEKSLEDFIKKVIDIIDQSSLSDKELLKNTIYESLISLFSKSVIAWESKKEDSIQLSFTFK